MFYPNEQMGQKTFNYEVIRAENDARLIPGIDAIRRGTDIEALEPFAKAYLGLFLDIDSKLPPPARIRQLANAPLAEAVLTGLVAALHHNILPTPSDIGRRQVQEKDYALGYVMQAGTDMLVTNSLDQVLNLPENSLRALVCFYYANPVQQNYPWLEQLILSRPDIAIPALRDYWLTLLRSGVSQLPGFNQLRKNPDTRRLAMPRLVLPVLQSLQEYKYGFVRELLRTAFDCVAEKELLPVVRAALDHQDGMSIKVRVLWLASAFLLAPSDYYMQLSGYVAQSREKALPLLDFVTDVLQPRTQGAQGLPPLAVAQLLRIIAPIFPPQHRRRGRNDDISRKVLWLFDQFALYQGREAIQALAWLRTARVMNRCSAILSQIAAVQV